MYSFIIGLLVVISVFAGLVILACLLSPRLRKIIIEDAERHLQEFHSQGIIREGIKKGGINSEPTIPRPSQAPKGQGGSSASDYVVCRLKQKRALGKCFDTTKGACVFRTKKGWLCNNKKYKDILPEVIGCLVVCHGKRVKNLV